MEPRAPRPDDAEAVFALVEARDIADLGEPDFTLDDLLDVWRSSELDLSRDTCVVEVDGRIRAYAEVRRVGSIGIVAPSFEGRGLGARLLQWTEARERERASRPHRQWIAASNERGRVFLQAAGYAHARSVHRMRRSLAGFEGGAPVPEGISIRALDVEADAVALHALDAASFAGAPDYEPMSAQAFREGHLEGHDIDRELTCIAERDGRIVGFALVRRWEAEDQGHIDVLAVAPEEQRGGIGTALLSAAFDRIKRAGLADAALGVATTNPDALRLYERMGMTPRFRFDTYERPLDRD